MLGIGQRGELGIVQRGEMLGHPEQRERCDDAKVKSQYTIVSSK